VEKKVQWVTVDSQRDGQRLDNFLSAQLKGLPKGRIYKMIRTGEVRINKGRCKPDMRVKSGDVVRIPPVHLDPEAPTVAHRGIQMRLSDALLYEDEDVLVLNKPAGLAVHGGSGLSTGLIEQLRLLKPDEKFLELVHRLDRETSGVCWLHDAHLHCDGCINNSAKKIRDFKNATWPWLLENGLNT